MATVSGYAALVSAAASLIDPQFLDDVETASGSGIRAFLTTNRVALQAARTALTQSCCVSLRDDAEFFTEQSERLPHFRNLAKAFALELDHACSCGHLTDAVRIGVDLLDLANAVRRGGLIIDALVSFAICGMPIDRLRQFRDRLDEASRQSLIADLSRIERETEPLTIIAERDRRWEHAVGWDQQPANTLNPATVTSIQKDIPSEQHFVIDVLQSLLELPREEHQSLHVTLEYRRIALVRLLFVDLALRSYRERTGNFPGTLDLLIPADCRPLPNDPFTGEPFRYSRVTPDAFLLYSLGPSQTDHGGRFGHWLEVMSGQADLCLDVADFAAWNCSK